MKKIERRNLESAEVNQRATRTCDGLRDHVHVLAELGEHAFEEGEHLGKDEHLPDLVLLHRPDCTDCEYE